MSLMPIVKYGDPVLRKKTRPVKNIDGDLIAIIRNMFTTLYAAPGIGLSANQVGIPQCFAVIDLRPEGRSKPMVVVNPVIEHREGVYYQEEGCLSIPGFFARVKRSVKVGVRSINENGLLIYIEADGLLARCLQHEIDHLNGRFYIDHLPLLQRLKIKRQIAAQMRPGVF